MLFIYIILLNPYTVHEMDFMLSTPEIIKSIRLSQKLSVSELAKKMGCSRQTIYNWEDGVTEPKLSQFLHLCIIVGFNPNNLLPKTTFTEKKDQHCEDSEPDKHARDK